MRIKDFSQKAVDIPVGKKSVASKSQADKPPQNTFLKKVAIYASLALPADAIGFGAGFVSHDPYLIYSRSIRGLINQDVMTNSVIDKSVTPERLTDNFFYLSLPVIPLSLANLALAESSPYIPKKIMPPVVGATTLGLVGIAQSLGRYYVPKLCGQKPKSFYQPNSDNLDRKKNKDLLSKAVVHGISMATATPLMVGAALKETPGARAGYLSTIANGIINMTDTVLNPKKDLRMAVQDWFNLNLSPLSSVPGVDYVKNHEGYYNNNPNMAFIPSFITFVTGKMLRYGVDEALKETKKDDKRKNT